MPSSFRRGRSRARNAPLALLGASLLLARPARAVGSDDAVAPARAVGVDDAVAPARAVGFDDAVADALARYPSLKAAAAGVVRAEAGLALVRSAALPRLAGGLSHLGVDSVSTDGAGTRIGLSSSEAVLSLGVPLVDARAWADAAEGREHVEIAEARLHDEERQVAVAAGRAWTTVIAAEHVVAFRAEALRTAEAHRAFTAERVRRGIGTELDVVRATKEVTTVSGLVEQAAADLVRAEETLGVLVGAAGPVSAAGAAPGALAAGAPPEARTSVERRPDVLLARARALAAETERRHAYTDWLPQVRLGADGFYQTKATPVLPIAGIGYVVQLGLTVPIYDGGLRGARRRERIADEDAARAVAEETVLRARAEIRACHERVRRARRAHEDAGEAARLAHRAVDLTRQRYAEGIGTDLDVVDALREARDADIASAVAENGMLVAVLELLAATGHLPERPSPDPRAHHGS